MIDDTLTIRPHCRPCVACPDKARVFFLAASDSTPEIAQIWAECVEEHVRAPSPNVNGAPGSPTRRRGSLLSDLAGRTTVGTASAVAMAWLSGDLFGKRTSQGEWPRLPAGF